MHRHDHKEREPKAFPQYDDAAHIDSAAVAELPPWEQTREPKGDPKEAMMGVSAHKRAVQSIVCGVLIGFICGFIGAGGGMMMLLILTSVLGYELKTAVGTSVFIMTFTALTGAVSHFAIGGMPNPLVWVLCVIFTLVWARIAAVFANKAAPETLNRATGVILVVLGIAVMVFSRLA